MLCMNMLWMQEEKGLRVNAQSVSLFLRVHAFCNFLQVAKRQRLADSQSFEVLVSDLAASCAVATTPSYESFAEFKERKRCKVEKKAWAEQSRRRAGDRRCRALDTRHSAQDTRRGEQDARRRA
jgi:hypothetical protein